MKRYLFLLLVAFASCTVSFSQELTEKELKTLKKRVRIGSVNDSTVRGEDREKSEQLKFYTNQPEDASDKYKFRVRVLVELTSNKKDSYHTSMAKLQGDLDPEYTGEDNWRFKLPHGTLEKVKLTGYIVQYGILKDDGEFLVLAEETDDVDTEEELKERSPNLLKEKATLEHNYSYVDSDGEVQQTNWE